MADVTRWEPERGWFCDFDTGIWRRKPDGNYEPLPHGTVVIPEADHLAALERVRVEALRDAREAVAERFAEAKRNNENGYSYNMLYGEDVFPAIDRLINAATTGTEAER